MSSIKKKKERHSSFGQIFSSYVGELVFFQEEGTFWREYMFPYKKGEQIWSKQTLMMDSDDIII